MHACRATKDSDQRFAGTPVGQLQRGQRISGASGRRELAWHAARIWRWPDKSPWFPRIHPNRERSMKSFLDPLLRESSGRCTLVNGRQRSGAGRSSDRAFDSAARRTGLLKHGGLPQGSAMIIAPTNAIHTFFMKFPIDVAFVGRDGRVRKVREAVRPWRMSAALRAYAVDRAAGRRAAQHQHQRRRTRWSFIPLIARQATSSRSAPRPRRRPQKAPPRTCSGPNQNAALIAWMSRARRGPDSQFLERKGLKTALVARPAPHLPSSRRRASPLRAAPRKSRRA